MEELRLKSTKRSERRHHYYRLKKKRQWYHGFNPTVHNHPLYRYIAKLTQNEIGAILGGRVSTCVPCSCISCGNPRNHIKSLNTLKEHIALYAYADGVEEYFGWRPRVNKFTKWW